MLYDVLRNLLDSFPGLKCSLISSEKRSQAVNRWMPDLEKSFKELSLQTPWRACENATLWDSETIQRAFKQL